MNQTLESFTYTYDSVGNKLTKQDSIGSHNYSYDNTYQLIQSTLPNEAFAYDAVGNRTNTTVDAANKLLQDPNATYQYDNNGNRYIKTQTDGTITYYSYDYEGRLTRVETQKPNLTTIAVYKYDALGRRIEKAVTENSVTTTTRYLYDGLNIVAEYDENNNVKAQYIQNLGIDDQLAMIKNGQTYYYHKDGLGSITAITDSAGTVVQSYAYDSFGNITNQTGSLIQPFMFTGREYDSESGTYNYRARTFDSKTGMFISKDPIGFAAGDTNLYRYVFNSPVNYTDPLGLKCKKSFWSRVGENFLVTNKAIPGLLAPTGMGVLTGAKTAETVGGITAGRWVLGGLGRATLQGVTFTGIETGVIAAGTTALNAALVGVAWEVGVGIGSTISAAILPCEEEIEVPKQKGCK